MSVTSGFFNAKLVGSVYDRSYGADELAEFFASLIGNGISGDIEDCFKLQSAGGMSVSALPGYAWINGYWIKSDTTLTLTHDIAPTTGSRIDAWVLRFSRVNRDIQVVILKGTSSNTPSIPVLTRTSDVWELMLGYVIISAGDSEIVSKNIIDTRPNNSYCGIISTFASKAIPDGSITEAKIAEDSISTEKIQNEAITAPKIAPNSIPRSKLAADAMYSPVSYIASTSYSITSIDLGKTLTDTYSQRANPFSFSLSQVNSVDMPIGYEVAIMWRYCPSITVNFSGVRACVPVEGQISTASKSGSVQISDKYGMIAMKKVENDATYGDMWVISGNVEVAS